MGKIIEWKKQEDLNPEVKKIIEEIEEMEKSISEEKLKSGFLLLWSSKGLLPVQGWQYFIIVDNT